MQTMNRMLVGVAWLGAVVVFGGGCGDDGEGTGAGTGTDTATVGTTMVPSTVSDTSGASAPTEGSATGTSATVGSDSMDADSDATTSTGTTVSTGTSDTTGTTGTTGNTTGVLDTTDGTTGDTTGTTGDATGDTTGDTTGTTGDPIVCDTLPVVYRDFKPLHTDFGCHMFGNGARPGLVMQNIGNDNKPAYNPNPPAAPPGWNGSVPQITSGNSFSEWYNSKDGINMEIAGELQLMEIMPGIYSFSSNNFYPLTGMGFGNNVTPNWANEVYPDKNGAFTTEIHTNFIYEKGRPSTSAATMTCGCSSTASWRWTSAGCTGRCRGRSCSTRSAWSRASSTRSTRSTPSAVTAAATSASTRRSAASCRSEAGAVRR
jgi:hypothetical protein